MSALAGACILYAFEHSCARMIRNVCSSAEIDAVIATNTYRHFRPCKEFFKQTFMCVCVCVCLYVSICDESKS